MEPSERKERTEAILREKGIPYFSGLPCVEPEDETELQSSEEVGIRIACLFCVVSRAFHPSDVLVWKFLKKYLKQHQLWNHLSPDETTFLLDPEPDRQSVVDNTWRSEALFVLMWAVGLFKSLPWPNRQSDTDQIPTVFPSRRQSPWRFILDWKLRSKSEILDASDLIYRLHWTTRQAGIEGKPSPGGLDQEVICEWHHAINWLTRYDDDTEDWDHVSTDT